VILGNPPPLAEDPTFSEDPTTGNLSVNVPRLYCETIGAPVENPVMQYCLDRKNWRREQLIDLTHRIEELMDLSNFAETVRRCREAASEMLETDDLTVWTPMDAERVSGEPS